MKTRRRFSAEFKAKVAIEPIQGHQTVGTGDEVRGPCTKIADWKRDAVENLAKVFNKLPINPTSARMAFCSVVMVSSNRGEDRDTPVRKFR